MGSCCSRNAKTTKRRNSPINEELLKKQINNKTNIPQELDENVIAGMDRIASISAQSLFSNNSNPNSDIATLNGGTNNENTKSHQPLNRNNINNTNSSQRSFNIQNNQSTDNSNGGCICNGDDDEKKNNSSNWNEESKKNGAKGNIYISKEMTEKTIPFLVNTTLSGKQLYEYIDGYTRLQSFKEFNMGQLRILNYDFYHRKTNEILYCILDRQNKKNDKRYKWIMRDKLFTMNEIEKLFVISNNKLPHSLQERPSFINQLKHKNEMINLIKNEHEQLFYDINWSKVRVFNKKSNKKRVTLYLTKPEFRKELNSFITSKKRDEIENDNDNIIPIVMFDDNGGYHIEYIHIMKIYNCCIGISYKYDSNSKCTKITATGIHINKEFIQERHQLISLQHECHCLDNFVSNIDYLQIEDPNKQNIQLKHYKYRCEKVTKFLNISIKYFNKMISDPTNISLNNLKKWIEKAKNVMTNNKNIDINLYLDENEDNTTLLYVKNLEEINNFYFQQTLNPIKQIIIPHEMHRTVPMPINTNYLVYGTNTQCII